MYAYIYTILYILAENVCLFSGGLYFGECLEYGWFKYINFCTHHATLCLLPLCQ